MPHFHIAYWASNSAPWRVFKRIEAGSAREAIERTSPQAIGRYRVTVDGSDETAGLFRVSLRAGCCELHEVTTFDLERANKAYRENEESTSRSAEPTPLSLSRRL